MFSGQNGYVKPVGKERAERLGAVRGLGAVMPIRAVGAVSDRRDDSGSTYSTNSTYS